jgi:hypothetical protein
MILHLNLVANVCLLPQFGHRTIEQIGGPLDWFPIAMMLSFPSRSKYHLHAFAILPDKDVSHSLEESPCSDA